MTHEIATTSPTRSHAVSNKLFKNKFTQEYSIRVKGNNGRWRWVSTGSKDRLEAMRMLERTGVGPVLDAANDARFKDRVVEILTQADNSTVQKVVEAWIADAEMRLAVNSLSHHKVVAGQMLVVFSPHTSINDVSVARLNEWICLAPTLTMRRRRMSVLEDLFTFAFDEGYRKDNPGKRLVLKTADLTFDQMERKVKPHFTQPEVDKIMACDKVSPFWKQATQLGWQLGLRIIDVANLQWGSFCAKPGFIVVWQQKTRRRVELDLSDPVMGGGSLNAVIAEMRAAITDTTYCFPDARERYNKERGRFSDKFIEQCKLAGIHTRKPFHSLRMGAAIRWKAAGRSLEEVGQMLGHTGTENAKTYTDPSGNRPSAKSEE